MSSDRSTAGGSGGGGEHPRHGLLSHLVEKLHHATDTMMGREPHQHQPPAETEKVDLPPSTETAARREFAKAEIPDPLEGHYRYKAVEPAMTTAEEDRWLELQKDRANEMVERTSERLEQAKQEARQTFEQRESSEELRERARERSEEARKKFEQTKGKAKDTAETAKDTLQETAEAAKEKAREKLEGAKETAQEVTERMREKADELKESAKATAEGAKQRLEGLKPELHTEERRDDDETLLVRLKEKAAELKERVKSAVKPSTAIGSDYGSVSVFTEPMVVAQVPPPPDEALAGLVLAEEAAVTAVPVTVPMPVAEHTVYVGVPLPVIVDERGDEVLGRAGEESLTERFKQRVGEIKGVAKQSLEATGEKIDDRLHAMASNPPAGTEALSRVHGESECPVLNKDEALRRRM